VVRFLLKGGAVNARVTLVAGSETPELVRYLNDVGFEVSASQTPTSPRGDYLIVLMEPEGDEQQVARVVGSWLQANPASRVIIVSDRPARLKPALHDARGRIHILPAPVFCWQLVDTMREAQGETP
jgi:hypothetical protein